MNKLTAYLQERIRKPAVNSEKGRGVNVVDGSDTTVSNDNTTVWDYKRMLDNDGTIKGLYSIFKNVVLSLPWTVEGPNADIILDNFTKPPGKGGMSTTMRQIFSHMLLAKLYGWAPFEKVSTVYEGRVILSKLAPRSVFNYEILIDSKGGFNGLKQLDPKVDIGVPNSFVFTINGEHDPIYGESAFKAAYKHWLKKRDLDDLDDRAAERYTVPPEVLKAPKSSTEAERNDATRRVQKKRFNSVITLIKGDDGEGYDLETLNPTLNMNLEKINYHDFQIARSVGMQWVLIVGSGSVSGSYALSKDQSQTFVQALEETTSTMEEYINKYIIAPLIDINDPSATEYPKFKIGSVPNDKLIDLIQGLLPAAGVSSGVAKAVNQKAAEYLGAEAEDAELEPTEPAPSVEPPVEDDSLDNPIEDVVE